MTPLQVPARQDQVELSIFSINPPSLGNLRGDLYGGFTAAVVALPLALAFGVASGAGPLAGLYGAICVGLFASLFGGTPSQISGPTGPMTIVSASLFTQFGTNPAAAFTVVMLAGTFQIGFGYLRLGRYINLMPYPVVSGFMTGIGCILIIMQLDPLLGYPGPQTVMNALTVLPGYLAQPSWPAVLVGVVAIALCFGTPEVVGRVVPAPLLALAAGSLIALALPGVEVLGDVPSGLPAVQTPVFEPSLIPTMVSTALVLAALGSIDSLLTSLVADNATATFHDSDKELVGQGFGNVAAGVLGGIPGAGATIRTLTNIKAGGRTPLSGAAHALVLLAITLGLGPVVSLVPHAALAGVLVKVGVDVIDWRFLRRAVRMPRIDIVLMVVVLVLTVFVDVVTAVGVGVVLASLAFVKEVADHQARSIQAIADVEQSAIFTDEEAELFRRCRGRALVFHLSGLMSFGAANEMGRRYSTVADTDVLIVDLLDVPQMDASAGLAVEEMIQRAVDRGQQVIVVGLNLQVARLLGALGSLALVRETMRLDTRAKGLAAAAEIIEAADRVST